MPFSPLTPPGYVASEAIRSLPVGTKLIATQQLETFEAGVWAGRRDRTVIYTVTENGLSSEMFGLTQFSDIYDGFKYTVVESATGEVYYRRGENVPRVRSSGTVNWFNIVA